MENAAHNPRVSELLRFAHTHQLHMQSCGEFGDVRAELIARLDADLQEIAPGPDIESTGIQPRSTPDPEDVASARMTHCVGKPR